MRIVVDLDRCESHGQCELAAAEIFRLDDDLVLQYDPEPGEALRKLAEAAAQICPTHAISIED